jgi:tetratricopeptide (TPR) repeat protein
MSAHADKHGEAIRTSGPDRTGALVAVLRDHLGYRRIAVGLHTLNEVRPEIETLAAASGVLTGLIAQWVDAGFADADLLQRLVDKFPAARRSSLPLIDYLHLRMAEGALAMSDEDVDSAAAHFRFVESLEGEVDDPELLAIANFWAGRCLRKTGHYDEAMAYTVRGEELALACGYAQMAAIMQMSRSWLAFQKGKLSEALAILRHAEDALSQTDDYLSRGNIQSVYGRIARRQGRYERAVECFERAIAEYREGGGGQTQLARALLNLAFVRRLVALEVQKVSTSQRDARERIAKIRTEATSELDEAMAIYARHHNHRGIAGVHINRGFLRLDEGDLEAAAAAGAEAFRHGEEKHDHIVMARARTLECIIELAALDEQVGDATAHHEAAESFARDAVRYGEDTENRRLLARAHIWQGLAFAAGAQPDLDAARRSLERATALLQPDSLERQYVWEELDRLRAAVVRARPVDATLRAWSAGVVDNTSFQQMTEEFARIIIPKVWEREGRKVARVAAKLSISPKKVRRILHAAGVVTENQFRPLRNPDEDTAR